MAAAAPKVRKARHFRRALTATGEFFPDTEVFRMADLGLGSSRAGDMEPDVRPDALANELQ